MFTMFSLAAVQQTCAYCPHLLQRFGQGKLAVLMLDAKWRTMSLSALQVYVLVGKLALRTRLVLNVLLQY